MRTRACVLAALMLVTGMAGCIGDDDTTTDGSDGPGTGGDGPDQVPNGPSVLPFGNQGCQAVIAIIAVPAEDVAPYLPEGFRSVSVAELAAGDVPNPTDDGNLGLEMFVCDEVSGLTGPVPSAVYGSIFTGVEPPEEHRHDGVNFHFVKWDVLIADGDLRTVLRAGGVPAINGTAEYAQFMDVAGRISYQGTMTLGDNATYSFEGIAPSPAEPTEGSFVEFTEVPNGLAQWYAEFTWDLIAIGPTTVEVPSGSLAAEIAGETTMRGSAFAGIINFDTGNVTLP